MAVPTREAVIGETDLEFAKQHPGAPERLDPNDPGQAHLVQEWQELYDKQLKLRVDRVFFSFYPHAPDQLDPGDPSHAQLIEFWNDIRNLIEHGTSRWNWEADPTPADPFPDGGQMDGSQFATFIGSVLADVVQLASEGEIVTIMVDIDDAGRGPALPWLEAALGSPEALASELAEPTPDAYSARPGPWLQEQEGFCYGLLWEVSGGYDFQKDFAGTSDDSAEHLREAFYAGVATGRHRGAWPNVHNRALLLVGNRMAHGDLSSAGYQWLLNALWHSMNNTSRDLSWPKPEDQHD